MKKQLLLIAAAASMALSASAQWSTGNEHGVELWKNTDSQYGRAHITNNDGVTYNFFHYVNASQDAEGNWSVTYPMIIQILDNEGNKLFDGRGYTLSDERNLSFTKTNTELVLDHSGNAIVVFSDQRNAPEGEYVYTDGYWVYKVSPTGEVLWESKALNNGEVQGSTGAMQVVPLADGGAVFAWQYSATDTTAAIAVERLNGEGESMWQINLTAEGNNYTMPFIVPAEDNDVLLVWSEGDDYEPVLKARRVSGEGELMWDNEVVVWDQGGYPWIPGAFLSTAIAAPEGVMVCWRNVIEGSMATTTRIAYIDKVDGHNRFANQNIVLSDDSDTPDYQLDRQFPNVFYNEEQQAFYAIYYAYHPSMQDYAGIYSQKFTDNGTLLWGNTGTPVWPVVWGDSDKTLGDPFVRDAGNGNVAYFYLMQTGGFNYTGAVYPMMRIVDEGGEEVMAEVKLMDADDATKFGLAVSQLIDGDHYVMTWKEESYHEEDGWPVSEGESVRAVCVFLDGTVTAIDEVDTDDSEVVSREYYSLDGRRINSLQNGVNIVVTKHASGKSVTTKVMK